MKGLKIKCPNCKKVRHITTEHYKPDETPKGNFAELIDPWKKWRWNTYDDNVENTSSTPRSLMICPGCAAPLAPKGKLTVLEPEEKPEEFVEPTEFTCDVCGKACKSMLGLGSHKRSHKEQENDKR